MSAAGGVNAAEAAEASTLKALMQLHTSAPAKQRAGRDRRLVRSMLQDAQDTLLQSLAVISASDLHQAVPQLIQLHCLAAVQDSIPASAPVLPASEAPPGFAPKPAEVPSCSQSSLAHHLWPFVPGLSNSDFGHLQPDLWPVQDPKPMLQLLRVHQHLDSKQDRSAQQHLLLAAALSATASCNYKLVRRLVQDMQAGMQAQDPQQHVAGLLDIQAALKSGSIDISAAAQKLYQELQRLQTLSASPDQQTEHASVKLQMILQLVQWSTEATTTQPHVSHSFDIKRMIKEILTSPTVALSDAAPPSALGSGHQDGLIGTVSERAAAWLVYADYLYASSQPTRPADTAGQHSVGLQDQNAQQGSNAPTTPDASSFQSQQSEVIQAYSMYLSLACQTQGPAGVPQDYTSVLLKLLELVVSLATNNSSLGAVTVALQRVPVLAWRTVVPQLFALLANEHTATSESARAPLQSLGCFDAASVVFPALVEIKRIDQGMLRCRFHHVHDSLCSHMHCCLGYWQHPRV